MKLCNDCKNLGKKVQCKYYGIGSTFAERCKDYEEPKQTNADRIRSMSDEELAEFLTDYHRHPCKYCIGCKVECHVGMAEWLKSEAKE